MELNRTQTNIIERIEIRFWIISVRILDLSRYLNRNYFSVKLSFFFLNIKHIFALINKPGLQLHRNTIIQHGPLHQHILKLELACLGILLGICLGYLTALWFLP